MKQRVLPFPTIQKPSFAKHACVRFIERSFELFLFQEAQSSGASTLIKSSKLSMIFVACIVS
jgi:hypothetical protein